MSDEKSIFVNSENYDHMKHGKKTVDLRLNSGFFSYLKEGEKVTIVNAGDKSQSFKTEIKTIEKFPTFEALFKKHKVHSVLPEIKTEGEAIQYYSKIYDPENVQKNGLLALTFKHEGKASGGKAKLRSKSRARSKSRTRSKSRRAKSKSKKSTK